MKPKLLLLILFISFTLPADEKPKPKKRNYFWPPLLSFVLPGFDQWKTREFKSAGVYSGLGVGGLALSFSLDESKTATLESRIDRERFYILGLHAYQTAGSLSLFQSFKEIAKNRDDFNFLTNQETLFDVTTAPFRMDFLIRPTTFIPLALVGVLVALEARDSSKKTVTPKAGDLFFSTAFSYGAGVGEEAMFRGWLMPVSMRWFDSPFWSNTFQATLFAAAHLPSNQIPWPQFVLGWYLGFLSQQSNWTIAEGAFIHTWWDIVAFMAEYTIRDKNEPAMLRLPPVVLTF